MAKKKTAKTARKKKSTKAKPAPKKAPKKKKATPSKRRASAKADAEPVASKRSVGRPKFKMEDCVAPTNMNPKPQAANGESVCRRVPLVVKKLNKFVDDKTIAMDESVKANKRKAKSLGITSISERRDKSTYMVDVQCGVCQRVYSVKSSEVGSSYVTLRDRSRASDEKMMYRCDRCCSGR